MKKRVIHLDSQRHREQAKRLIDTAPAGFVCRIAEPVRSDEQNRKLWPTIDDIRRQVPEMAGYSAEDIKLRFMHALGAELRFLPVLEGQGSFPVGYRSSTLTVEQFSALIELLHKYGAEHGVQFQETV